MEGDDPASTVATLCAALQRAALGTAPTAPQAVLGEARGVLRTAGVEASSLLELALRTCVLEHARASPPRGIHPFVDNVLDLCLAAVEGEGEGGGERLLEPSALFAVLEDVAEASPVGGLEAIWRLVEDRRLRLFPLVQGAGAQRARLALLRVASGLLRRLSRTSDTVMCGKVLLFLAFILPLSERSGVNVTGSYNTENVTDFEGAAEDASEVVEPCAAWRGGRAPPPPLPSPQGAPRPGAAAVVKAGAQAGVGGAPPPQPPPPPAAAPPDPPFALGGRLHVPAAATSLADAYRAAASGTASTSTAFYRTFWRMQRLLYHPATVLATSDTWALYVCGIRAVLRAFEREDVEAGLAVNLGTSVPAAPVAAAAAAAAAPRAQGAPTSARPAASAAPSALEDGEEAGAARKLPAGGAAGGKGAPGCSAASAALLAAKAAAATTGASAQPVIPTLHLITRSALDAAEYGGGAEGSSSARRGAALGSSSSSSSSGSGAEGDGTLFGDKFLTAPTLLTLEIKDASLRRHVILQFLISMHSMVLPRKATAAAPTPGAAAASASASAQAAALAAAAAAAQAQQQSPSPATIQRDLAPLQAACYALLRRCAPSGHRFARAVASLLSRETHMHGWKLAGAAAFERYAGQQAGGGEGGAGAAASPAPPAKRPRTSLSGLMASRAVYPNYAAGGAPPSSSAAAAASAHGSRPGPSPAPGKRSLAWASAGLDSDLLAVCSDPARAVRPTLPAYLVPLRLAIDPSQGMEQEFSPANDGLYVWRGLRLLAAEKLEAFFAIAVGKNTFTEAVVEAFKIKLPPAPAPAPAPAAAVEGGEGEGASGGQAEQQAEQQTEQQAEQQAAPEEQEQVQTASSAAEAPAEAMAAEEAPVATVASAAAAALPLEQGAAPSASPGGMEE